jgi:hypothetical protein
MPDDDVPPFKPQYIDTILQYIIVFYCASTEKSIVLVLVKKKRQY